MVYELDISISPRYTAGDISPNFPRYTAGDISPNFPGTQILESREKKWILIGLLRSVPEKSSLNLTL